MMLEALESSLGGGGGGGGGHFSAAASLTYRNRQNQHYD